MPLTLTEQAEHAAALAETYREMLTDFAFVSVDRRREFVRKMRAYQDRCAELMALDMLAESDRREWVEFMTTAPAFES
jgi:hypothetical protein